MSLRPKPLIEPPQSQSATRISTFNSTPFKGIIALGTPFEERNMKSIHNKVRSVIAAIVCVFCTLALIPTHNAYASVNSFTRIAGNTRYETMSQIVEQAFPTSSEYAVLAAGSNFPDALAASSLAGAYNAPIILTDSYSLSSEAPSRCNVSEFAKSLSLVDKALFLPMWSSQSVRFSPPWKLNESPAAPVMTQLCRFTTL
ncbi:cell wall-binding repeat-containing protein [Bifidobacterium pseudocatenulatum]|nr:cell wall-binding repeat-containing protein [Bifidobacterium pseudocatenulatum]RGT68268.1 cell wall-binding repeat-containing protein [Bifidobacterium pseudocatenulatum]